MHDFKHDTAEALPELIRELKAGGYKVVHMVPKGELTTLSKYDEMLAHQDKFSANNTRPGNSVIRTIGEQIHRGYVPLGADRVEVSYETACSSATIGQGGESSFV